MNAICNTTSDGHTMRLEASSQQAYDFQSGRVPNKSQCAIDIDCTCQLTHNHLFNVGLLARDGQQSGF